MKTGLRFLYVFAAVCLLAGCSAQKHAAKSAAVTAESEALYAQALKALEDRRFMIRVEEFYLKGDDMPKHSTNSYISMKGNWAKLLFAPGLFPLDIPVMERLSIEDQAAQIERVKHKKNGDVLFRMKIDGNASWLKNNILITLYGNTNKCFVQINEGEIGFTNVHFIGYVCPDVD